VSPARATAPGSRSPDPPPAGACGCAGDVEHEVLQHVLTATYWVDPGDSMTPYTSTIRFTGRRAGLTGALSREDRFEQEETIHDLLPGSGPVAVTTRVHGVSAGDWLVRARPAGQRGSERGVNPLVRPDGTGRPLVKRILWSKGNPVASARPGSPASTRMAAFATAPGIIPMSWAGFVAVGLMAALAVLAVLLARVHVAVGAALAVAAVASLAGAAGARGWYVMLQRGKVEGIVTRGLCIQGFVAGAVLVGMPGLLLAGIPVGTFFDAAAPGLFFAMAIGRQGCFFTGCCVGRPTASRWGIWSSDGRIGARRVPVQHLESLVCLLISGATLFAFLRFGRSAGGAVFIGAMAVYILARQGLLAFRAEPRRWSLAGPVTLAAAAAALLADIVVSVVK
jgi:phosphatidylglycerol:prolipoprotein diacylglycerol transferase